MAATERDLTAEARLTNFRLRPPGAGASGPSPGLGVTPLSWQPPGSGATGFKGSLERQTRHGQFLEPA